MFLWILWDSRCYAGLLCLTEAEGVDVSGALVSSDMLVPQAARLRTIARPKKRAVNFFMLIVPFLMVSFLFITFLEDCQNFLMGHGLVAALRDYRRNLRFL